MTFIMENHGINFFLEAFFPLCTPLMTKVLLIQKSEEALKNASDILRLAEYEVLTAEDGKTAVEVATTQFPDVIISDIDVPLLDGFGILKLLQRNVSLQVKPFILICEKDRLQELRKAMLLGADDCLVRPFSEIELLETVETRLKRSNRFFESIVKQQEIRTKLQRLSRDELLHQFLEGRNTNFFSKGERIYNEGNRPVKLFYIRSGKVRIVKDSDEGKELVVQLRGAGEFLGHVSLMQGGAYKDSAETMEHCEILIIPKTDFDDLLRQCSGVVNWFNELLAKDIEIHQKRLVGLAYNSLRKKVADALLMLQQKFGKITEAPYKIDMHRDELAHIAGTATESLIRTLRDFTFEKLIDIDDNGTISIINENRLKNIFNR